MKLELNDEFIVPFFVCIALLFTAKSCVEYKKIDFEQDKLKIEQVKK